MKESCLCQILFSVTPRNFIGREGAGEGEEVVAVVELVVLTHRNIACIVVTWLNM
jgi:hypothetical protein